MAERAALADAQERPAEARAIAPTAERLALLAGIAHVLWGVRIGLAYPGLVYESDRVANQVYLQSLLNGSQRLGELWYFPAPKLLTVLVLGPLGDGIAALLVAAAAAGVLAAALTYLVARAAGPAPAVGLAVLLALDPLWTPLVAIASADLLLAAGLASSVALWATAHCRLASGALLLAVLAKPPAAVAALALLLDRSRTRRERLLLAGSVVAGIAMTAAGYALLLGGTSVPTRFLRHYTDVLGGAEPALPWLAGYAFGWIGTSVLRHTWPVAAVGLVALLCAGSSEATRPLRQLVAAALALAAACVALAAATDTEISLRFLWLVQLVALALCLAGPAILLDRLGRSRALLRSAAVAAVCLVVGLDLRAAGAPVHERYTLHFERGGRDAMALLAALRPHLARGERVNVPLWLQPLALWQLDLIAEPERLDTPEIAAAQGAKSAERDARAGARWVVFQPNHYQSDSGLASALSLVNHGFDIAAAQADRTFLLRAREAAPERGPADAAEPPLFRFTFTSARGAE